MIAPSEFIAALEKHDIRFVTGVPDSLLKDICSCITSSFPSRQHIIATNEGSAVGLAIGHYLASGRPALVYMQNSGLGNAINPLASLADPAIYGIPIILMVGWRGEIRSNGKQVHDEPQHIKQGQISIAQLDIMDIPYRIVDCNAINPDPLLLDLVNLAIERSGPVALLVRKQTFTPLKSSYIDQQQYLLTREAAITAVIGALPDDAFIVSTTGMASRELFELRKTYGSGHHRDFLTVGGMGHASQIAAGIANTIPDRQVICLDGDGAMLMHMGGLTISADCPNLLHVVLNNGAHDSVGGQPTKGAVLDLAKIAMACGYAHASLAVNTDEIVTKVQSMLRNGMSSFLEIKCRRGARADLGRPDRPPIQNKTDFMCFLKKDFYG
jgi:phosphonopyruvate decarboxylase